MTRILFLFPNTSNDGVVSNAITILSASAKRVGCHVSYFETSFYHKKATAAQDRTISGEFKPIENNVQKRELKPYESIFSDFNQTLNDFQPDIIAVSANSLEYSLFLEIAEKADFTLHKPFIIVGGVHAIFSPEEVLQSKYVNAICIGEGEDVFEEFIIRYQKNKDITDIGNMWIKRNGEIYKNNIMDLIPEDRLWLYERDYSFYDREEYYLKPFEGKLHKKALVELSRGCPYSCNYCVNTALKQIYKGKGSFLRFKPMDKLKEELMGRVKEGFNLIQFLDENFLNITLDKLEEFCTWYKENISLPMIIQARAESINEDKIKLLHDIGVHIEMSCGVETGSKKILNEICNRYTSKEQTIKAFGLMKKYGIYPRAYVMIGFPNETRADVFETIDLIRKINPYLSIMSTFYPFVGVPLRQYCIDNGFISGKEEAKTFTEESILKNQSMSPQEIFNIRRVYNLYVTLPRKYFSSIEYCEKSFDEIKFKRLVDLSWEIRKNWPNYELD